MTKPRQHACDAAERGQAAPRVGGPVGGGGGVGGGHAAAALALRSGRSGRSGGRSAGRSGGGSLGLGRRGGSAGALHRRQADAGAPWPGGASPRRDAPAERLGRAPASTLARADVAHRRRRGELPPRLRRARPRARRRGPRCLRGALRAGRPRLPRLPRLRPISVGRGVLRPSCTSEHRGAWTRWRRLPCSATLSTRGRAAAPLVGRPLVLGEMARPEGGGEARGARSTWPAPSGEGEGRGPLRWRERTSGSREGGGDS